MNDEVNWSIEAKIARMPCHCDPDAILDVFVPDRLDERVTPARTLVRQMGKMAAWEAYLPKAREIVQLVRKDTQMRALTLHEMQRLGREIDK